MNKNIIKKCVFGGSIWTILLLAFAHALSNLKGFSLNDILFIEGVLCIVIAILSSLSGNTMGVSMQGLGQTNAQYISNGSLEMNKIEKQSSTLKSTITIGLSTLTLIISGTLTILLNFIL